MALTPESDLSQNTAGVSECRLCTGGRLSFFSREGHQQELEEPRPVSAWTLAQIPSKPLHREHAGTRVNINGKYDTPVRWYLPPTKHPFLEWNLRQYGGKTLSQNPPEYI